MAVFLRIADHAGELMAKDVDKLGLKTKEFSGKAGDVVIWHERVLHGGAKARDPARTRTMRSETREAWALPLVVLLDIATACLN